MTSSMSSITTALPTPAHSVNGSSNPSEAVHDVIMSEESPHKRKRQLEDMGDREQKKVHIEERRLGIEDLHLDVGEKYLLCRTQHQPSRPNLSEDLFQMFGLTGLAGEVARVLPNGEKNAIRKTYKGHIKRLGVNGHFDSVKTDPDSPDGLLAMVRFPQEEWTIHHVKGKEIENGLSQETRAKMAKAVSMCKGIVPKSVWDSSVLGELSPGNFVKGEKQASLGRTPAPGTPTFTPTQTGVPHVKTQPSATQGASRPQRSIKKRSYGDSSFEGYGEGFPDDDLGAEAGYSTGEGESGQKRRKKNSAGGQPFPAVRQPSYGPGMVGA
ncbi:hypothetical protein VTK73DRAFT_2433 [Phialemonium thermophilum]|uniref:Mediator of RNA polymerase II transcription subunit 19 n=1 Tax=Phialemonium thermophilum TaxID=223376 RepID=A0ABR3X4C6_9PEZI